MSIIVKEKCWYSNDGAYYVHRMNRKKKLYWNKIIAGDIEDISAKESPKKKSHAKEARKKMINRSWTRSNPN